MSYLDGTCWLLVVGAGSIRRTNSQLFTLPRGSGMNGAVSSCLHLPSTMNLYWWYLQHRQAPNDLIRPGQASKWHDVCTHGWPPYFKRRMHPSCPEAFILPTPPHSQGARTTVVHGGHASSHTTTQPLLLTLGGDGPPRQIHLGSSPLGP